MTTSQYFGMTLISAPFVAGFIYFCRVDGFIETTLGVLFVLVVTAMIVGGAYLATGEIG